MALYSQIEELSLTLASSVQYRARVWKGSDAADGGKASHLCLQVELGDIEA